jgi:hypothetical protein
MSEWLLRDPLEQRPRPLIEPGWYWWPCFPGCMPGGDASGPFEN